MAPRESYINLTCKSHLLPNQAHPQVLGACALWGALLALSCVLLQEPSSSRTGSTGTSTQPVPGILQVLNVCTTLGRYVQQDCRPGTRPWAVALQGLPGKGGSGRWVGRGRGSCKA